MTTGWHRAVTALFATVLTACASPGWRDMQGDLLLEVPTAVKQELVGKVNTPRDATAPVRIHTVRDLQLKSMMATDDVHVETDELHVLRPDGLLETTRTVTNATARSRSSGNVRTVSVCGLVPLLSESSSSVSSGATTAVPAGKIFVPLDFSHGFDTGTRMRLATLHLSSTRICAPRPGDRFSADFDSELQLKFEGNLISRNRLLSRKERIECQVADEVIPAATIDPSVAGEALRVSCRQSREIKDVQRGEEQPKDLHLQLLFVRAWGIYLPAPQSDPKGKPIVSYKVVAP